jgi:hypothetical protein
MFPEVILMVRTQIFAVGSIGNCSLDSQAALNRTVEPGEGIQALLKLFFFLKR